MNPWKEILWTKCFLSIGVSYFEKKNPTCFFFQVGLEHFAELETDRSKLIAQPDKTHFCREGPRHAIWTWISNILVLVSYINSIIITVIGSNRLAPAASHRGSWVFYVASPDEAMGFGQFAATTQAGTCSAVMVHSRRKCDVPKALS